MGCSIESRRSEALMNEVVTEQAGSASEAGYQGRVPGLVW